MFQANLPVRSVFLSSDSKFLLRSSGRTTCDFPRVMSPRRPADAGGMHSTNALDERMRLDLRSHKRRRRLSVRFNLTQCVYFAAFRFHFSCVGSPEYILVFVQ